MYAIRGHARTTLSSCAKRRLVAQLATLRTTKSPIKADRTGPQNAIADKLRENGAWAASRGRRKGDNLDKYRVNIVDNKLCDDVVEYIKPTLERHKGCDLIDIFPGVGLWSQKLNDVLQPRSHLLMEPDEAFYKPYLEPLLERPGAKLLPESGIIWEHLNKILNPTELPHQVERKYGADEMPERNDTLLVTMNLSMYPKRKFRNFDSLAQLVLFQLMSSIRPGSLFQKYGLVRMLIWVEDAEKGPVLPRTVQRRKKMAIEAEMATDYVCEIAGGGVESLALTRTSHWFRRDEALDLESTRKTLERMRQHGFVMPPGREPDHVLHYNEFAKLDSDAAIDSTYSVDRPFLAELDRLSAAFANGEFEKGSPEHKRLKSVEYLRNSTARRSAAVVDLIREHNAAVNAYLDAGSDEQLLEQATALCRAWSDKVKNLDKGFRGELILQRDNMHILHNDPPILNWDRRYVEPLQTRPSEFFPQVTCTLLDIQPKAVAPVLRDMGPGSTRGGDIFDLILRGLVQRSVEGISKSLEIIAAGAGDGIVPHCPKLVDPRTGGSPIRGFGELSARCLNEHQLVEIAEGWMKWPFRPNYSELVSRTLEDFSDDDEEIMGNFNASDI